MITNYSLQYIKKIINDILWYNIEIASYHIIDDNKYSKKDLEIFKSISDKMSVYRFKVNYEDTEINFNQFDKYIFSPIYYDIYSLVNLLIKNCNLQKEFIEFLHIININIEQYIEHLKKLIKNREQIYEYIMI